MKRNRIEEKYVFQTDEYCPYQCGPISIYNTLIKHNKYMSLRSLIKMCQAHHIDGTSFENMNKTIEQVNKRTKSDIHLTEPKLQNIVNLVNSNKPVIILYHWSKSYCEPSEGEHYALITDIKNNKLKIVNYSYDDPIKYISMKELKTMLLPFERNNGDVIPKAWTSI